MCCTRWDGTPLAYPPNSMRSKPVSTHGSPRKRISSTSAASSSRSGLATTGHVRSTPPTLTTCAGPSGYSSSFTTPTSTKKPKRQLPFPNLKPRAGPVSRSTMNVSPLFTKHPSTGRLTSAPCSPMRKSKSGNPKVIPSSAAHYASGCYVLPNTHND